MNKLTNSILLLFALIVVTQGCKKETVEIQPAPIVFDEATKVVQDQDVLSQLFVVAGYAQAIGAATERNENFSVTCGEASFPDNCAEFSSGCIDIFFDNCSLPLSGLQLNGKLRFTTFGSNSPSSTGSVNTQLTFLLNPNTGTTSFTINGRAITLESANSFIRFANVSTATGYDLFEVYSSGTIYVNHLPDQNGNNAGMTKYIPFTDTGSTFPAHIKLRVEPGFSSSYNSMTSAESFLADLLSQKYIMKITKSLNPISSNPEVERWQAVSCNPCAFDGVGTNTITQSLHLETKTDPNTDPNTEDIDGLEFDFGCQHFKNGKLIMLKRADAGCYYKYRDYDFGYVAGGSEVCADQTGDACDDFVLLTEYIGGSGCDLNSFIEDGKCGSIEDFCTPECRGIQCF